MGILSDTDKYREYKYKIDELIILIDGEENKSLPPERISSMSIIHDYERNIFPIFKISIILESDIYYRILENKNKVKFKLRIQKYYRIIGNEEKSLYKDYINGLYDLILDDDDYDKMSAFKKEAKKSDYQNITEKNENELFDVDNPIEFFLFRSDIIKKSKKQINTILQNATVTDAIAYAATISKLNNILMSPSDNTTVYDRIVIPQMEMFKSIQFIDTYYGLYKKGSIIYFDFSTIYILSYDGKCTAYRENESQDSTILIPEKSSRYSSDPCSVKKLKDNTSYIICDSNDIGIRNESISFDAYASNDATFVDSYTGEINTTNSTAATKGGSSSIRVFENVTENKWIDKIYAAQTEAKSVVVEVFLRNYDISVLAPNKRFKFLFEDTKLMKKYKGIYKIAYIKHDFVKNGVEFKLMSSATFRRM